MSKTETSKTTVIPSETIHVLVFPNFTIFSKQGYLIGETGIISDDKGAQTIVSPSVNEDLGSKKILLGLQADIPLGKCTVGVQLSFDGSQYSKPVVSEDGDIQTQALHVFSLDLEKYKAPSYRVIVKTDKPVSKGNLIQLKFCV